MKDLLIRADATRQAGMGHVMRCLALAQAWRNQGGRALFLGHCEGEQLQSRISSDGFDIIPLKQRHPDPVDLKTTIGILHKLNAGTTKRDTWLVADGYHFDDAYQKGIKDAGYSLLLIDDYGQSGHCCSDIILNQNILADSSFYPNRNPETQLLLGPSYTLIRGEFKPWRKAPRQIPDVAHKILVTMGGGDPDNLTLKVLQALQELTLPNIEVKVVIGHTNPNKHLFQEECVNAVHHMQILFSMKDMPELMAWSDLAIIQAGGTLWELLFMGCAVISYATTMFHEEILKTLDRMHIVNYLGYVDQMVPTSLLSSIHDLSSSKEHREEVRRLGMDIVDGQGAERVLDHMRQRTIP